jgi:hypothetical protein
MLCHRFSSSDWRTRDVNSLRQFQTYAGCKYEPWVRTHTHRRTRAWIVSEPNARATETRKCPSTT